MTSGKLNREDVAAITARVDSLMCETFGMRDGQSFQQTESRISKRDWLAILGHIAALEAERAAAGCGVCRGWQPMETAPLDRAILVATDKSVLGPARWDRIENAWRWTFRTLVLLQTFTDRMTPTRWMDLPTLTEKKTE